MEDEKEAVKKIFSSNNITVPANHSALFENFIKEEKNIAVINEITRQQNILMAKWNIANSIDEIIQKPIRVLNATVGKPFETKFDFANFGWKDIGAFDFVGLDETGLYYDENTRQLTGIPTRSGDIKITFKFKMADQGEEDPFNEKQFTLIINPDPKTLWKNLPSEKTDPYWKEDDVTELAAISDRNILVSSKRGRSHANVAAFREDDYAFKDLQNGWSIVVVSDGAGSANISRMGSAIACKSIVEYFETGSSVNNFLVFDELIEHYKNQPGDDSQKKINSFLYNNLGKAAFDVHKKMEAFAVEKEVALKDLAATLIFSLFKKYKSGYAFLSFGVGDCPMAVLNKDVTEVTLLNWIDVGEFGGGTRFITMPEIFQSDKFSSRLSFQLVKDFSFAMFMSDGIYDPKFVVESKLADIKKWQQFLEDLNGKNDDKAKVVFNSDNKNIVNQFATWMDFWSIGNHDDRTLAIVF